MASKTASLSVEGVGGKTRDEDMDGGGAPPATRRVALHEERHTSAVIDVN